MATQRADRPEIVAAVKAKLVPPVGFIGRRFFPIVPASDKTGTFFHKTLDADAASETRGTEYANWTRETLAEASTGFTCAEHGKAYTIPEAREKAYGGVDACDRIGVTAACRSVLRKFETLASEKVLTTARYNNGTYLRDGLVLIGLQTAAASLSRYFGKTVLAGSVGFFQNFALSSDVSAKLSAIMGQAFNPQMFADALAGQPSVAVGMLRAFLPFDEILVGDNEFWGPTGKGDSAVVGKLPPADWANDPEAAEMIMREEAVYGVCPWYLPDASARDIMFTARSFFDDDNDNNVYKAKGWFDLSELNSGAVKIVKFTAPAVSTTTTTTTTTTTAG
jgi:hypothetical protein